MTTSTIQQCGARSSCSSYELYLKTVDMSRTKYGGSEAVPRTPTEADPRSIVARS